MTELLHVCCTDTYTHPSREIALLGRAPIPAFGRLAVFTRNHRRPAPDGSGLRGQIAGDDVYEDVEGRRRWRFRCPTCRRDVQMTDDRMAWLFDELTGRGIHRIDVSLLP